MKGATEVVIAERIIDGAPSTTVGKLCASLLQEYMKSGADWMEFDVACQSLEGERFSVHFDVRAHRMTDG